MPELPDVLVYLDCLRTRVVGEAIVALEVLSPFVLRSVEPALAEFTGRRVTGLSRLGKRIVLELCEGDDELFLVVHLMIAGRLRWRTDGKRPAGSKPLVRCELPRGVLWLTEAGRKRRASLFAVRGRTALREHDRGGLEVLDADGAAFAQALARENRTLKRALTDPRLFSGIGNAYSDEILFTARLSPLRLTSSLDAAEVARLHSAVVGTLREWTERLRAEVGDGFPEKVTAFRDGMAVHGRFGAPCRVCGRAIQRIRYADNECNYCALCQNQGVLLRDRALSQLLKRDWPRTLDELEERRARDRGG